MAAKKSIDLGTLLQTLAAAGVEVTSPAVKPLPLTKKVKARKPRRPPLETKPERKRVDPKTVPAELRNQVSTCPKCGHKGPIGTDFGVRMHRGVLRKQSWCADCRATTNYHARERKYQSHHQ